MDNLLRCRLLAVGAYRFKIDTDFCSCGACHDYAVGDGGCTSYFVSISSYIGSRGVGWTISNINDGMIGVLVYGSIANILLSYLISCAIFYGSCKANTRFSR